MPQQRTIAVMGATGAQGGGLARAILNDPSAGFTVRAITRDVNSDKAQELVRLGAEVVAADLDDPKSLQEREFGIRDILRSGMLGLPHTKLVPKEGHS